MLINTAFFEFSAIYLRFENVKKHPVQNFRLLIEQSPWNYSFFLNNTKSICMEPKKLNLRYLAAVFLYVAIVIQNILCIIKDDINKVL